MDSRILLNSKALITLYVAKISANIKYNQREKAQFWLQFIILKGSLTLCCVRRCSLLAKIQKWTPANISSETIYWEEKPLERSQLHIKEY